MRYMRIEALAFWESTCRRKEEWWRASEHQDTDNKQKYRVGKVKEGEQQKDFKID